MGRGTKTKTTGQTHMDSSVRTANYVFVMTPFHAWFCNFNSLNIIAYKLCLWSVQRWTMCHFSVCK